MLKKLIFLFIYLNKFTKQQSNSQEQTIPIEITPIQQPLVIYQVRKKKFFFLLKICFFLLKIQ